MKPKSIFRGLLSILLAGALFFFLPADTAAREQESLYFGLLHAHTSISGADASPGEVFSLAAQVPGLDFFAVTDHSHSFENANSGSIAADGTAVSPDWDTGKAAAAAVTNGEFVGIFGYEMSFRDMDNLGHISTFGTPGWQSRNQKGFDNLTAYYNALTQVPGSVSQFNHPGPELGEFQNFAHRSDAYDDAIALIEIGDANGICGLDTYISALNQGWHLAPTLGLNSWDLWAETPTVRTAVLAEDLTEESLYEAMGQRRVYATEDSDLEIRYTLNGHTMGTVAPYREEITMTVSLYDPTDSATGTVEVLSREGCLASDTLTENGGTMEFSLPGGEGWYFLRITQPDQDVAITAPIWMDAPEEEPEPTEAEPAETEPPKPTQPPEDTSPDTFPEELGVSPYFGLLHGHSVLSGGEKTAEALYAQAAARQMDFFAITDHSHSLDNDCSGAIGTEGSTVSTDWAEGKAAAENAATEDFAALYGYEMSWPDDWGLGHISTFRTPGWQSRNQEGFASLTPYYEALTTVPGSVSQFNHPGPETGEFDGFSHYAAAYDGAVSLLELGDEDFLHCSQYTAALDAGWHVAPTAANDTHGTQWGSARTVLLAPSLEEDNLYEAMANRCAYATQDEDFTLCYQLDEMLMGGTVTAREQHKLHLFALDPTDAGSYTVKVITRGGRTAASAVLAEGQRELTLDVPGGEPYYYLHITQSDGDIAVTAPVWSETYENIGISAFSTDTELPVQGQPLNLKLRLYNEEAEEFTLDSLIISAGDLQIHEETVPGSLAPASTLTFTIPLIWEHAGSVTFQAAASGTIGGITRSIRKELTLRFHPKEMVNGILVDLGHSSLDNGDFNALSRLAAEANLEITFLDGSLSGEGRILILPPPEADYSPDFLQQVKIFSARGGSVVVCGGEDAARQNLLLRTLGSTLRFLPESPVSAQYPTVFNGDTLWCEAITADQYYVQLPGCAMDPGDNSWLVKSGENQAVLCAQTLPSGGCVLAGSCLFLCDDAMPLPENRWDLPTANQTITEALLGIHRKQFPITPIAQVRNGESAVLYRVKGYTTSGTDNPFNTFPDTLYLQDDTGGIALFPFREDGIPVGMPMEVVGYLEEENGNPVLMPVDYFLPEEPRYRYVPETMNHSRITDYDTYGGRLLQAEAKVYSVTLTPDGQGVSRFTLVDAWGDQAVVMIEDGILSGAYGTNTLASEVKIGRTVRAMGLLHLDENGIPVLRVRNCEEVVWVPPIPRPGDKRNPYTGDPIFLWSTVLSLSLFGIQAVTGRRKKQ